MVTKNKFLHPNINDNWGPNKYWIYEYMNIRINEYTNIRIYKYTNIQIYEYMNKWIYEYMNI